ncbi:hypothetical protein [Mucilaginibacter sp.]|jgi:hypothetical protein|uniref:hypothetical protein n=1 Tax=Mucilaginibacter sp. TaxID=1882438 RepID=UPI002CAFD57A|nr:hypothetical protein [Mucilaginibacter sp.]HTI61482.1 hypothetical protein [Mucilaginibacter sp.]
MKAINSIIVTTALLVTFYILLHFDASPVLTVLLYFSIPIAMVIMALSILLDDSTPYPELGDEEWGYRDKGYSELSMF